MLYIAPKVFDLRYGGYADRGPTECRLGPPNNRDCDRLTPARFGFGPPAQASRGLTGQSRPGAMGLGPSRGAGAAGVPGPAPAEGWPCRGFKLTEFDPVNIMIMMSTTCRDNT
jgi:hypothetical protein